MSDNSGWSDLPLDLFSLIFSKLSLPQLLRSAVVCVSWSAAVQELRTRGRRFKFQGQSPWIMFGGCPYGDPTVATFYSLDERREYNIPVPDPPISHRILIGTNHGWVITVDSNSGLLRLLNPITGSQIDLPSFVSYIHDYSIHGDCSSRTHHQIAGMKSLLQQKSPLVYEFLKVTLSADPSLGGDYTVALVNSNIPGIFFTLSGQERWLPLITSIQVNGIFFHKGKLFATSRDGSMHVCVIDEALLRRGEMPNFTTVVLADNFHCLAETPRGDLLLIRLQNNNLRDAYTILPEEEKNLDRIIQKVKVSEEVIVFKSMNQLLCLSACDFPHLTPNSIYFMYNDLIAGDYIAAKIQVRPASVDVGIRSMTGNMYLCILPAGDLRLNCLSVVWFRPE